MKTTPLQKFLLLLSVSTLSIFPITAGEKPQATQKTKKQIQQEHSNACYHAVRLQVLRHLNPTVPTYNRFSRVVRPMPPQYYDMAVKSHGEDGTVSFEILHFNRLVKTSKPQRNVVATGTFQSKNGTVFLVDKNTGKLIAAAEHPLVKNSRIEKLPENRLQP